MIRHTTLPQDINQRLPLAAEYLQSHSKIVFAYLFGGLSKGDPSPLSDVDISV
jgi:predicted nucleotidyltransferase